MTAGDLRGRTGSRRQRLGRLAWRWSAPPSRAAVRLARDGRLAADDVDPLARPRVALALLEARSGRPEWARLLAADPLADNREKLAACPGLPHDVTQTLASDPDVRVVAELALWATTDVAAQLATHPHAEVRRAVAASESASPAALRRC